MQTLTRLGNSNAIIIPATIVKEAKYKRGQKFTVNYIPQTNGVFIQPAEKHQANSKKTDKEFQQWLNGFLAEDAELLDELAHR